MRARTPLIIEETILAKIDEIAGEKHRRAAIIETALLEYIAREEKKAKSKPAAPATAKRGLAAAKDRNMTAVKTMSNWDVEKVRKDFPVLSQTVNGKPLVYLDNGASSQVPQSVIDRTSKYLAEEHSNIHRGVHYLSQHATTAYEAAREKVKRFINAREVKECIFVRGTTEGINLVAHTTGENSSAKATRSSSRRWSTTRTSSRGR